MMNTIQNQQGVGGLMTRYFQSANAATAQSIKNISSGHKINSAADDAAGLAIAQKMYSQVTGISAAGHNAQDAISMVRVADGVLGGASDIVNRMSELAVRAGNGTLGDQERGSLQQEFSQLSQELDRMGRSSTFNGNQLFDGSTYTMQVGASGDDTMDVEMGNLSAAALGLDQVDLTNPGGASDAMSRIKDALNNISSQRSNMGAAENGLQALFNNLGNSEENLTASLSKIMDTDIGKESINRSISNTLGQVSLSMMKNSSYLMQYNAMQLLLG